MPVAPTPLGYRLYPLDDAGHVTGPPVEFLVTTDDEAIDAAINANLVGPHELWNGARMVSRFNFMPSKKTNHGQGAATGNH